MKLLQILLIIVMSFITAFATAHYFAPANNITAPQVAVETAFERVIRTGTLRCAYLFWPRFFEKDMNTGAYNGMYYDLLEEMGRRLSLKIEWTEEIGTGNAFEGLKSNRYDAVCVPFTPTPERSRVTDFSRPVLFIPDVALVRQDDNRFDHAFSKFNDPAVKISVLDGELGQTIARTDFPKATTVSLPNLTDISQVLEQVATGKADMAMTEASTAYEFMKKNPNRLKQLDPPLRVLPGGMSVGMGEFALKNMLDTTIDALHTSGYIGSLINKYAEVPGLFLLPAQPWNPAKVP